MTSTPGSVRAQNTPKRLAKMPSNQAVNVNDLLNFTLPPRQHRPPTSLPRRSRKIGTAQGVWNKERFVNAQYRFVMNPSGDYTVHFADPDIFFQWQDILQVIIPRSSLLASAAASSELSTQEEGLTFCPICLSPPTAPRMTKCGHVFCYPCILHYLSTSENKWARCPICFDSVHARQLKAVKWFEGPVDTGANKVTENPGQSSSSTSKIDSLFEVTPRAGSTLKMRLVQRPQITTLALPRSHTWPSDLLPPHQAPFHFLPDVYNFSKFMLATPGYLITDLTRDLDELASERRILQGMSDSLGVMFVDAAEVKVREQISKAAALEIPPLKEKIDKAHRDVLEIDERFAAQHQRQQIAGADNHAQLAPSDIPHDLLALRNGKASTIVKPASHPEIPFRPPFQGRNQPRQRRNINPPPPSTSTYYYYQAESGLPLFLHPLDIRILLSHFNSYSAFPDTITVRVEFVSEGTVNDDLRKRCRYLAHMPEGADVVFIESDLEGVVGSDGLKSFEAPLKQRSGRRKEKEKKEEKARVRAEEREKERQSTSAALAWNSSIPSQQPISIPVHEPHEDFSALEGASNATVSENPTMLPNVQGVWGSRSFASALHSNAPSRSGQPSQQRSRMTTEDDWDLDNAFHELEQRTGGGGRRKRANKLVVLGSGGGARRR
ncbi:hypothetical protein CPB83DRAFT_786052 [Crepidotus variabilis]|uniref:RING-type domain-containing protein n=1 Tax=Crepidotus variabilis TaxID=179855 RepID=A0A9P6ENC2_9AGAR|nr:hypothetical protein CPB83DRAFT_786052 [Crepidotus variabilis]